MNLSPSQKAIFTVLSMCVCALPTFADEFVSVDDRGRSIAPALRRAVEGSTVWLEAGEYNQKILVSLCDNVTLRGSGVYAERTVIKTDATNHHFMLNNFCRDRSITITFQNLTFAGAGLHGEGFKDGLDFSQVNARFINCRFIDIQSQYTDDEDQPAGSRSVGAINIYESSASFLGCLFRDCGVSWERADAITHIVRGGAINSFDSELELTDCEFSGNYLHVRDYDRDHFQIPSEASGGAIATKKGTLRLLRCEFESNVVSGVPGQPQPQVLRGGAVYSQLMDRIWITDCVFNGNRAEQAGHMAANDLGTGGAVHVRGNDKDAWVFYSTNNQYIENIADVSGGALYAEGSAIAKSRDDLFECNSLEQVDGDWRDLINNEFIDCEPCPADLNGDGLVDKRDLLLIFYNLGPVKKGDSSKYDLNEDGVVNVKDYFLWLTLGDC
ncbi:MAG: dockerin type I domain-containing protein [Phycisphaerales bacterium]|nr:dockerin type I domain-containing protein [Phycisphaerales bacterium]